MVSGRAIYVSVDSPPVVVRDTVIVGSSMSDRPPVKEWVPGDVQAFDVRTGKLKWVFHVIPRDGELGAETWQDGAHRYTGNANVWSMMSGDDELGLVYLPTTTPNSDYYGGFRKGDGLFAESIVAVNVETGQRAWHFQAVHHGVWDYDLPAAPTLVDITVGGRRIKALAQVSKQAFTYVFDRATGTPLPPTGPQGLPLLKPPYSRMTAYNLNTGTIAWQVPTGAGQDGIRNHPALAGRTLPDLGGQGGLGGPLVTKTLLIYGLLSSSGRADRSGRLVAYDKATGATLGAVALPGAPLGTPMTYAIRGKQYVALTLLGGQMVSLALP